MQLKRVFIISVLVPLLYATAVNAAAHNSYWDFGIGPGLNVDGNGTRQVLFAPALNLQSGKGLLWYRFEGEIELIDSAGTITVVAGVSPYVRLYLQENGFQPFFEIGAGANLISRNHTGNRNNGGAFIFSPSAGAGILFRDTGRQFAVSVRYRHLSNADIFFPNEGMNMLYLLFSVRL